MKQTGSERVRMYGKTFLAWLKEMEFLIKYGMYFSRERFTNLPKYQPSLVLCFKRPYIQEHIIYILRSSTAHAYNVDLPLFIYSLSIASIIRTDHTLS